MAPMPLLFGLHQSLVMEVLVSMVLHLHQSPNAGSLWFEENGEQDPRLKLPVRPNRIILDRPFKVSVFAWEVTVTMLILTNGNHRRTFTKKQQQNYLNAVKCLQVKPAKSVSLVPGSKNRYEDFLGIHILYTDEVHFVVSSQPYWLFIAQLLSMLALCKQPLRSLDTLLPWVHWHVLFCTAETLFVHIMKRG